MMTLSTLLAVPRPKWSVILKSYFGRAPKRLCRHVLGRTTDLKWRCPICIVRESQQYPSFRRRQALSMIVDSIHISWRNTEEMYQSVFT
jgi:hypothetical protein